MFIKKKLKREEREIREKRCGDLIRQLQTKINELLAEKELVEKQNRYLKNELVDLNKQLEAKSQKEEDLKIFVQKTRIEIEKLRDEKEKIEEQNKNLKRELINLQVKIKKIHSLFFTENRNIQQILTEISEVSKLLQNIEKKIKRASSLKLENDTTNVL